MNPHTPFPISLQAMFGSLWRNRHLIYQMTKRDIAVRYRGSAIGMTWFAIHPVLMLSVYTVIFGLVLKSRWAGHSGNMSEFALTLFAGLIFYNFFSDCINKAPSVVIANTNYVKKIIFPLEILPVITLLSALFQCAIACAVWLIFYIALIGMPSATMLYLPLIIAPLAAAALGCAWILAACGVYLKDIVHLVVLFSSVLLFLSPVFYPLSAIPPAYQPLMMFNPLTMTIESARHVMLTATTPQWDLLGIYGVCALGIAWLGYAMFQTSRKGFADVL
jgi:lipopolysaccharide transport system permease protein